MGTWTLRRGLCVLGLVLAVAGAPAAQGALLGYWSFDDHGTSGGAYDYSHRGNTGTLVGAGRTGDAGGHTGAGGDYALDLGASNNSWRCELPTADTGAFDSVTANNTATISLWIYGDAAQATSDTTFGFYNSSNQRQMQSHTPWGDSRIYWDVGGGTTTGVHRIWKQEPDSTKWKGQWNHYAFVKSGNTSKIYQNGNATAPTVPWHQGTTTASIGQIVRAVIGSVQGGGQSYGGYIDDFAVWDQELSQADIDDLATGTLSPSAWAQAPNHYFRRVRDDNPFVYYRFDNDTGTNGTTLADWSGHGRSGRYEGSPAIEDDFAYSIGGRAAHFNGSNTRGRGTTLQPTTAVTVEAWVKSDTENWNVTGPIVSKRDAFILHPRGGNKEMQFYVYSGGWTPVTFDLATIPGFDIREWHHYVGVYDQADVGNELKLYVDGFLRATASKTGNINASGQPIFIGFDNTGGGRWFDGLIDEVAVYDYALSFAQVRGHWIEAVPEPGTVTLLGLGSLGLLARRRRRR